MPPSSPHSTQGHAARRLFRRGTTSSPDRAQLREEGCVRLRFAAGAALFGLGLAVMVLPFVAPNVGGLRDGLRRPFELIPVGVLASLAMYWVAGRKQIPAERRLDLGLVYLVAMSGFISLFSHWLPYDDALDLVRGPSGTAFAILVYGTLVPVPPRRMLRVALLAAAMDPLALGVTLALGNPIPRPTFWLWLFLPTFGSAAVAVLASRTLYELSERLDRARELGAYTLVERLGAGGMGEVWRATHRSLARPAAIKLIRPERLEGGGDVETLQRRFAREAQATAALQSPHTIEVYDFGVSDDGTFYYVMELLDGRDLSSLVQEEGPLPPARVVRWLLQACHSLGEAHAAGMVHRDVKPENLFSCRRGREFDVLKVLDFGLVKIAEGGDQSQITQGDTISGTPAYLAPEALTGRTLDGRADIYALGCVAFALLTGRLVFVAESPMATMFAHAQQPAPAPSSVVPGLPDALDQLVLRCLEKNPDARPATCEELAAALHATGLADAWTPARAEAAWSRSPDGEDPRYADTVDLPS